MEKPVSEIPIYKICHLRSPDDISDQVAESTAAQSSSLSPEYNVLYVFYGNVEFTTDEGRVVNINDIFIQEQENPLLQNDI